ncbi:MAG: hypothetical protein JJU00_00310 [Opitutales bacterium]|nr:hypothetical protein [Opitutales bacterium]
MAVEVPQVIPIEPVPASGGTGFQPPYFEEVGLEDFRQRVESAALWLYTSPYLGAIHSGHTSAHIINSGTKNHDNGSEVNYGGAMAMITLARVTEDPAMKARALHSASWIGN